MAAKPWPKAGRPPQTPGASRPPLRAGRLPVVNGKAGDTAMQVWPDADHVPGDPAPPQGGPGS